MSWFDSYQSTAILLQHAVQALTFSKCQLQLSEQVVKVKSIESKKLDISEDFKYLKCQTR